MSLFPPTMLDCVVAVGYRSATGGLEYGATGFLYGCYSPPSTEEAEGSYGVFLATNRHVLSGHKSVVLRFNSGPDIAAKEFTVALQDEKGKETWYGHEDPEVDVGVVLLNARRLQEEGMPIALFADDKNVLFQDSARAKDISEGDGGFILGFPMGDVGSERNYVIVRGGCIARIRDCLAGTSQTFLVDAFIFPGNSGGPVIIKPETVAIRGTRPIGSTYLIGMVSGYRPYQDIAISQQTGQARVIFQENSGLAVVVPADRIRETVDRALVRIGVPGEKAQRDRAV